MNDSEQGGWDGYVAAYELTAPLSGEEMALAVAVADEALRPAPPQKILAELTRLRALTVNRDRAEFDLELIAAAYTQELSRYPADVVVDVLREWPRANRFWPSMAELLERIKRLTAPRMALREALAKGFAAPAEPEWTEPSEADKAAVAELLAKHGYGIDPAGRVRPLEREPLTPEIRRRIAAETSAFRLPNPDDPRVLARLREMGVSEIEAAE